MLTTQQIRILITNISNPIFSGPLLPQRLSYKIKENPLLELSVTQTLGLPHFKLDFSKRPEDAIHLLPVQFSNIQNNSLDDWETKSLEQSSVFKRDEEELAAPLAEKDPQSAYRQLTVELMEICSANRIILDQTNVGKSFSPANEKFRKFIEPFTSCLCICAYALLYRGLELEGSRMGMLILQAYMRVLILLAQI
ncbi:hypothetical protein L218DRAFT_944290 [Marasmius fiardii PR-910]|nr:hypothetical protein L218DRAFT_944290 [Marasmius fiardii PR-910]